MKAEYTRWGQYEDLFGNWVIEINIHRDGHLSRINYNDIWLLFINKNWDEERNS